MKQISICLIMAAMCLSSCKLEKIIGGCTYEGVYIETVTGLVNAHGYQITLPGSGGEFDFYLDCVRPFYDYCFEEGALSIYFADEVRMTESGPMKVITGRGSICRFRRTGLGRNARTYLDSAM